MNENDPIEHPYGLYLYMMDIQNKLKICGNLPGLYFMSNRSYV